uniref:Uncharacterized protein n=1 Tax=Anguilla anguilla TaxID=7936 RepID=A0A0E9UYN5_ANGAN
MSRPSKQNAISGKKKRRKKSQSATPEGSST